LRSERNEVNEKVRADKKSPVRFYTMSQCHVLQNLVADLQSLQYILTDTKCEIEIMEPELLLEYAGIYEIYSNAVSKFYDALFLARYCEVNNFQCEYVCNFIIYSHFTKHH
jgi:hypothetical protein